MADQTRVLIRPWADAEQAATATWTTLRARERKVYWNDAPACRARGGPHGADCMLFPDHDGDHFGKGVDVFGPMGPFRWPRAVIPDTEGDR